jgi:hypothetical protein
MSSTSLYEQVQADRRRRYEEGLANGSHRPFIWPWDTLPALYLFLGMLILPRLPATIARILRVPLIALICGQGIWTCVRCRTIGIAGGYGIGLANVWGCIMTMAYLWFLDVKTDFYRLETRRPATGHGRLVNGQAGDEADSTAVEKATSPAGKRKNISKTLAQQSDVAKTDTPENAELHSLTWQGYPPSLTHCAIWLIDLLISFRGVNWNWRLAGFPAVPGINPAPKTIITTRSRSQRPDNSSSSSSKTLAQIQATTLKNFILLYLAVDAIKAVMIHDPYFLGLAPLDSAHPWHPLTEAPFLTRVVRLLISLCAFVVSLSLIVSPPVSISQFLHNSPTHLPSHQTHQELTKSNPCRTVHSLAPPHPAPPNPPPLPAHPHRHPTQRPNALPALLVPKPAARPLHLGPPRLLGPRLAPDVSLRHLRARPFRQICIAAAAS